MDKNDDGSDRVRVRTHTNAHTHMHTPTNAHTRTHTHTDTHTHTPLPCVLTQTLPVSPVAVIHCHTSHTSHLSHHLSHTPDLWWPPLSPEHHKYTHTSETTKTLSSTLMWWTRLIVTAVTHPRVYFFGMYVFMEKHIKRYTPKVSKIRVARCTIPGYWPAAVGAPCSPSDTHSPTT